VAPPPTPLARAALLAGLRSEKKFDLAVIGGGATGLGVALDASARGLKVAVFESGDFAQATSSRSTKLVHGGVRYLAQGHIALVREALAERGNLLANAPHLAQPLPFIVPTYRWWERAYYGLGLAAYRFLAGRQSLGATRLLTTTNLLRLLPGVRSQGLRGGVLYWDAQFDDARLAIALARSAAARGAIVLNHCAVTALHHTDGKLSGLTAQDHESGESLNVMAGCVVNATGVWVDAVRQLDAAAGARPNASTGFTGTGARADPTIQPTQSIEPLVSPSQGVHLVLDRSFLPGRHALLVPRTSDGRVLFVIPWLGKLVLGTTDTPVAEPALEPRPLHDEVEFILREAAQVLARAPTRADVRSSWVGLRPLVRPSRPLRPARAVAELGSAGTGSVSREHTVLVSVSGLITVTGGKWTTYRSMAEDVLHQASLHRLIAPSAPGLTRRLALQGAPSSDVMRQAQPDDQLLTSPPAAATVASLNFQTEAAARSRNAHLTEPPGPHLYGDEADHLASLEGADRWLWRDGAGGLSEAMVRFAVRYEMARSVADVLARRSRLLLLDARAASAVAPKVGAVIAEELGATFDVAASVAELQSLAQACLDLP